jgi:hypothetical protein
VGVLLFALLEWVSVLYNLPVNIVILLASANVIYGIYALTLAFLVTKPVYTITVLAIANAVWVCICIFIALYYVQTASLIGVMFIILEAVFESPRVHRRPVCLSQATLPDSFKLS